MRRSPRHHVQLEPAAGCWTAKCLSCADRLTAAGSLREAVSWCIEHRSLATISLDHLPCVALDTVKLRRVVRREWRRAGVDDGTASSSSTATDVALVQIEEALAIAAGADTKGESDAGPNPAA